MDIKFISKSIILLGTIALATSLPAQNSTPESDWTQISDNTFQKVNTDGTILTRYYNAAAIAYTKYKLQLWIDEINSKTQASFPTSEDEENLKTYQLFLTYLSNTAEETSLRSNVDTSDFQKPGGQKFVQSPSPDANYTGSQCNVSCALTQSETYYSGLGSVVSSANVNLPNGLQYQGIAHATMKINFTGSTSTDQTGLTSNPHRTSGLDALYAQSSNYENMQISIFTNTCAGTSADASLVFVNTATGNQCGAVAQTTTFPSACGNH
jgi:hypothetical protein